MVIENREVRFDIWCAKCKHKDVPEEKDPCNECLDEGYNIESERPVRYEEKES